MAATVAHEAAAHAACAQSSAPAAMPWLCDNGNNFDTLDLQRIGLHCGVPRRSLGTVMRHDFLPAAPIAPGPPRMREAPGSAGLIAPTRRAHAIAPRRARAPAPAVPLAAVAAAAYQHLDPATGAAE